jgi:uncharacterized cupin superfamily protein
LPSFSLMALLTGVLRWRNGSGSQSCNIAESEGADARESAREVMNAIGRQVHVCRRNVELKRGAVPKNWILGGAPISHSTRLTRSGDLTASTFLWDCTAGTFNWYYDVDETVFILEGEVSISIPEVGSTDLRTGDTIHFPSGTKAVWTVPKYVRKVAFVRHPMPLMIGLALISVTKLKKAFFRFNGAKSTLTVATLSASYLV